MTRRICQYCNKFYDGTSSECYCSITCRDNAKSYRAKIKRQWERTQRTLSLEERLRELDEILGE